MYGVVALPRRIPTPPGVVGMLWSTAHPLIWIPLIQARPSGRGGRGPRRRLAGVRSRTRSTSWHRRGAIAQAHTLCVPEANVVCRVETVILPRLGRQGRRRRVGHVTSRSRGGSSSRWRWSARHRWIAPVFECLRPSCPGSAARFEHSPSRSGRSVPGCWSRLLLPSARQRSPGEAGTPTATIAIRRAADDDAPERAGRMPQFSGFPDASVGQFLPGRTGR